MMASSLASHLCAFIFFFSVGVRRLHSFFSLYLKNSPSSSFRSKAWYSSSSSTTMMTTLIKNLDLYILLIALPIASFSELYLFFSILPHRFFFLHHYALLTFFWLLLLLILLHDSMLLILPIPDAFLFLFAATGFLLDFYLGNNDDGDLVGSVACRLSASLSLLCGASCVYISVCHDSFLAEFALSAGLVFKGTWLLQVGLNLYSDAFTFMGCHQKNMEGHVKCDLKEDTLRAMTLMNLLFVSHATGVVFCTFALFGFLSSNRAAPTRVADHVATGPLLEASNYPI